MKQDLPMPFSRLTAFSWNPSCIIHVFPWLACHTGHTCKLCGVSFVVSLTFLAGVLPKEVKSLDSLLEQGGLGDRMDRVERIAKHMVGSGVPQSSVKEGRPPITSHVLDTVSGRPAVGVKVVLDRGDGKEWEQVCCTLRIGVERTSRPFL